MWIWPTSGVSSPTWAARICSSVDGTKAARACSDVALLTPFDESPAVLSVPGMCISPNLLRSHQEVYSVWPTDALIWRQIGREAAPPFANLRRCVPAAVIGG